MGLMKHFKKCSGVVLTATLLGSGLPPMDVQAAGESYVIQEGDEI